MNSSAFIQPLIASIAALSVGVPARDIDRQLNKIDQDSGNGVKHSPAYYERYKALVEKFRAEVEKRTFFDKLEDWWEYRYDIWSTGITLVLEHNDSFDLCADDPVSAIVDTSFELLHVPTKMLTVEQYAQAYGVTTTTVRQWIRRGKLRTAMKAGSEWRIPELAEIMDRGYRSGHYMRKEYLTDLPEEYAFFNEYDYVDINQNKEHKDMYDLCFSKDFDIRDYPDESKWGQFFKEMQIDRKEREKFELYLIASPFVEA